MSPTTEEEALPELRIPRVSGADFIALLLFSIAKSDIEVIMS